MVIIFEYFTSVLCEILIQPQMYEEVDELFFAVFDVVMLMKINKGQYSFFEEFTYLPHLLVFDMVLIPFFCLFSWWWLECFDIKEDTEFLRDLKDFIGGKIE